MTILMVDFMNQCHRARSGFMSGDNSVVFNFFRGFRAQVEQFKPSRVILALEGRPVKRYEEHAEYKANRLVEEGTEQHTELMKFFRQKDQIVDLLSKYFPVSVVRHPTSECDDTIYNLIRRSSTVTPWVVVSNDSDFTQLLNEFSHVNIWNPIRKSFLDTPEFDYVSWKSLRGDSSDNIPGIPGCGDKTALRLINNPEALKEYLQRPGHGEVFARNYSLIKFRTWTDDESLEMTSTTPIQNWDAVRETFERMEFQSLLVPKTWNKFTETFRSLWG